MKLKIILGLLAFGTLLSGVSFWLVTGNTSPDGGIVPLVLFYASLGLTVLGAVTLANLAIRYFVHKEFFDAEYELATAARQGFLLAGLVIVFLVLLSQNLWVWWLVLLVVVIFVLIEISFRFRAVR